MINLKKIENILVEMIDILRDCSVDEWSKALAQCQNSLLNDSEITLNTILSMYGGMGSLNDIVLYKDGEVVPQKNREFDALRTELYKLCKEK